jgi:nicotinamidase-related amidase
VKKTGRKKLIMAALWTEICLAMPAIQAAGEGYDVYAVTDASGGVSAEAHEMAVRRMVMAGVVPITWMAVAGELQRDWARETRQGVRRNSRRSRRWQRRRSCLGVATARPEGRCRRLSRHTASARSKLKPIGDRS